MKLTYRMVHISLNRIAIQAIVRETHFTAYMRLVARMTATPYSATTYYAHTTVIYYLITYPTVIDSVDPCWHLPSSSVHVQMCVCVHI